MPMLYAKENPKHFRIFPLIALVLLVAILPLSFTALKEYPRYTRTLALVPAAPIAIIFGASINPNGQLSPFLRDRVEGGVELYKAGKVNRLLVTGDHRSSNYDEPAAMKAYAVSHGVPEGAIIEDGGGIDTFNSCIRAYTTYRVRQAVLVTQGYHQPRALVLCRAAGIQATGYSVTGWQQYAGVTIKYIVREGASMWKAWYNILMTI